MELRVSIDERDDPDEEEETAVDGLPIVVSLEVIDSYGSTFTIAAGENGLPVVSSPMQIAQAGSGGESDNGGSCSL